MKTTTLILIILSGMVGWGVSDVIHEFISPGHPNNRIARIEKDVESIQEQLNRIEIILNESKE